MRFRIEQWAEIKIYFDEMFHGLGKVETSEELVKFSSIEPYVCTGVSLSRNGTMAASMPLHNLDSTFNIVEFNQSLEVLTLFGDGFCYTYRIPDELLSLRTLQDQ